MLIEQTVETTAEARSERKLEITEDERKSDRNVVRRQLTSKEIDRLFCELAGWGDLYDVLVDVLRTGHYTFFIPLYTEVSTLNITQFRQNIALPPIRDYKKNIVLSLDFLRNGDASNLCLVGDYTNEWFVSDDVEELRLKSLIKIESTYFKYSDTRTLSAEKMSKILGSFLTLVFSTEKQSVSLKETLQRSNKFILTIFDGDAELFIEKMA